MSVWDSSNAVKTLALHDDLCGGILYFNIAGYCICTKPTLEFNFYIMDTPIDPSPISATI